MDIELLKESVKNSTTYADVCRKMGLKPTGGYYKTIQRHIKENNIDTSHFTGQRTNICNRLVNNEKSVEEYLTKNSYVKAGRLKWKLLSSGMKKYQCECCGCSSWNNKQLMLQLHHINGDNTDNRIENLQFLCPNCHSQTENFCGRNIVKDNTEKRYYCRMCGKSIEKTALCMCDECYDKLTQGIIEYGEITGEINNITYKITALTKRKRENGVCEICGGPTSEPRIKVCHKCYHKKTLKIEWPSKEELAELIKTKSFTAIGKIYGVSDNAVHKRCKQYGLPSTVRQLKELGWIEENRHNK